MIEGLTPLGPTERPAPVRRTAPVHEPAKTGTVERALDPPPSTPPAEVLEALDHAQKVLADLESKQVSLRFSVDESSSKIHVKVVDGEGRTIREVPATQALEVLSGERSFGLGIDTKG
jgi:hypothetical protein